MFGSIDVASLYDFSMGYWSYSDSVAFLFFLFTPIKFVFNISRSWWPFQCLNPRQRYQTRLLVEESECHLDRGCLVKIQKTWMWVLYVGVYVLQLLWNMWYLLGIFIISVLLWLTCASHWLDKILTWLILLIISTGSDLLSNIIDIDRRRVYFHI